MGALNGQAAKAHPAKSEGQDPFPLTLTDVIKALHSEDTDVADSAMSQMCSQYDEAIRKFFRRNIPSESLAEDCAQSFMVAKFFGHGDSSQSFLFKYQRLPSFYPDEAIDLRAFRDLISQPEPARAIDHFLAGRLLEGSPPASDAELRDRLNLVVGGDCIFEEGRFREIILRDCTRKLLAASRTARETEWLNRFLLEDAFPDALPSRRPLRFRQVLLRRMKWFLADWFRKERKATLISVDPVSFDHCVMEDEDPAFDSDFAKSLLERAIARSNIREKAMLEYLQARVEGNALGQDHYAKALRMSTDAFKVRYCRFIKAVRNAVRLLVRELVNENDAAIEAELEYLRKYLPKDLFED